jgi:solute carrier family 35 (UDP-galactose transporter), member B1
MFDSPITVIWVQTAMAWLMGFLINNICYKEHTKMPIPNLVACAIVVIVSTHTYILAIYITNFPIVMMVKSCNIISVVFVGVFCSRVKDKNLNLGPKKIIVAIFITLGILLYNFGGDTKHQSKATDILGVILLVISLIADGFLPDFQAVIKSEYKPRPIEMFEHINKWVTILSLSYALVTGQLHSTYEFTTKYPQFGYDIVTLAVLTAVGQMFVYQLIKQFKQHIVPFVITTRKIFTVVISIIFYNHVTTPLQILAIVLVFCSASYEYLSELYWEKKEPVKAIPDEEELTVDNFDDKARQNNFAKI